MIKEIAKQVFWSLPYDTRRFLFKVCCPRAYQKFQALRTVEVGKGQTLMPFDKYQCIFVHVPKCAGISVCNSLFSGLAGLHMHIRQYQLAFTKSEFDSYFKFTFVRNPWDRLVSAYCFLKKGGMGQVDKKWAEENLSIYPDFDSFVKSWINRKNIFSYTLFIPQYKFICTQGNLPTLDFIGFFENLEEDFSYVQERIKKNNEGLLFLNKTKNRKDYQEYYTEESKQIVAEVYKEDIQMLGYTFDNSSLNAQLAKRNI